MFHYLLCGLKVESDLAFPELRPWDGPADQPFDIEFRLGRVEPLPSPDATGERFEAERRGRLVFTIKHVGRALIEEGRRIVFDAFPDIGGDRLRLNFIGTIQSILWHQRGYVPLHASTVMVGENAIAIAGGTRSGKSVVAAALTAKGCALVADDFTIVDTSPRPPVVLPGYQALRLWKDACVELGLLEAAGAKAHPFMDKYVVVPGNVYAGLPPPLSDLFILAAERAGELKAVRLDPVPAFQSLLATMHMPDEARGLGLQEQVFSAVNALVTRVRLWRVAVPDGLDRVDETADAIRELASAGRE